MTTSELNRDCKRLAKRYLKAIKLPPNEYYGKESNEIEEEFKRLYYAGVSTAQCSERAFITMYRLNLSIRAVPLHSFGVSLELSELAK